MIFFRAKANLRQQLKRSLEREQDQHALYLAALAEIHTAHDVIAAGLAHGVGCKYVRYVRPCTCGIVREIMVQAEYRRAAIRHQP